MEFIKPPQIASQIMTLMDEADKKVIIISPYYKIEKWYKLQRHIQSLKDRKVAIEVYVREGQDNIESIREAESLGIAPILIPNLHCKLYINEKYGIISSMNLHSSSDINSLDIGYKTQTQEEYDEIIDFYNRYILKYNKPSNVNNVAILNAKPIDKVKIKEEEKFDIGTYLRKRYLNRGFSQSGNTIGIGISIGDCKYSSLIAELTPINSSLKIEFFLKYNYSKSEYVINKLYERRHDLQKKINYPLSKSYNKPLSILIKNLGSDYSPQWNSEYFSGKMLDRFDSILPTIVEEVIQIESTYNQ